MIEIGSVLKELADLAITRCEPLGGGFSAAGKYKLYTEGTTPAYILKVYGSDKAERRERQFEWMSRHYAQRVKCPRPIRFGVSRESSFCYLVLEYIRGDSADRTLPPLSAEEQYRLGVKAGVELHRLHRLEAPHGYDWYPRRVEKYRRKSAECRRLGLDFHKRHSLEAYIENNLHLLRMSRVCFQHDDFHPQNLIVDDEGGLSVVDFDSFDWGDPWEEFFKVPKYTIQVSRHFAIGQVAGYFGDDIPGDFWRKYNLFVALNQHASQLGGYASNTLEEVRERTRYIVETHDFRNHGAPEWFRDG